jgi:GIY-YIG catalytic domain
MTFMRLEQHRSGRGSKFVQKYKVFRLVHVEAFATSQEAIAREKQLKFWNAIGRSNLSRRKIPTGTTGRASSDSRKQRFASPFRGDFDQQSHGSLSTLMAGSAYNLAWNPLVFVRDRVPKAAHSLHKFTPAQCMVAPAMVPLPGQDA